jgi:hypothetical protein
MPAAGVGGDVAADQRQDGCERDQVRVGAGLAGGTGRDRGGHIVHEQQRSGFLPRQGGRASAQDPAGALDCLLQGQVRDLDLPFMAASVAVLVAAWLAALSAWAAELTASVAVCVHWPVPTTVLMVRLFAAE